ncbi:U2 small nuclear ribonucleoprotein auxiliary factor 35 kDa subunit-related protein [Marchantia polymorpha subsp. ruderalis]|uniref:C3H1-type domain-containing protein n=1 Tax=Marchantia polymorpha TaxID=3197 RepID=A0A2R6WKZ7_MARPO|nr:hypothetical protein MARPO_0079s0042 [Marchantia polymorpha]BBN20016.1 hypothetical protein Mp_8g15710 [Marchantia polymorpha subsp. ruderalis]|eukprot:PTQ34537.1 hypothetical protein MARPO_0079s0042 [Marchantia polymorpha]
MEDVSVHKREKVGSGADGMRSEEPNFPTDGGDLINESQTSISEPLSKPFESLSRKEKRKTLKKLRRKQVRQEAAEKEHLEELARLQDAAEQLRIQEQEKLDAERVEKERVQHDEEERLFHEREKKAQEEFERKQAERLKKEEELRLHQEDEEKWRYVEDDGPAEIIWQGNEIIVRKKRVKVPVEQAEQLLLKTAENASSNPLPPQSTAFAAQKLPPPSTPDVSEPNPMFGTEQDKTHCPFHIKTGVCRFGVRCSRVHVYPDQSFTLLMRNMYTGPGLSWDHDEGLEHSDEEVAEQFEEFYEDVHSEFLQYGELVNFKVCKNGSSHLRGNVYVHYQTEAGAQAAYNAMNGRFYAGKQITCEFVGVTRWRVALCGEYMKGHHKPCSHGTACNFLHCFRNPRGEYDWADWDSPPPRYWAAKMAKLFGYELDYREDDDRPSYHDDSQRRYRSHERARSTDGRHRSEDRQSRFDDHEHVSRHRERRWHRNHDKSNLSSSDDIERSSRSKRRDRRHHRSSPDSTGKRSRRQSSGEKDENGKRYHQESRQSLETGQDEAVTRAVDGVENIDSDRKYGRDHDVDDNNADELQHRNRRRIERYGTPQIHTTYENRSSTRSCTRDLHIHDYPSSNHYKIRTCRNNSDSLEDDQTGQHVQEAQDRTEGRNRKRERGERERYKTREVSKSKRGRRKDAESESSDDGSYRVLKTSRSERKQDSRRSLYREKHRDALVGEYIEQEDRWSLDVDTQ